MSDLKHRLGVNEVNLVARNLKLEGVNDQNKALILNDIDHQFGIDSVSFDDTSSILHVAYDATHCCLDTIEKLIKQHGADIAHGWWMDLKEGYYRFVDKNVKENDDHEPWSCHKK